MNDFTAEPTALKDQMLAAVSGFIDSGWYVLGKPLIFSTCMATLGEMDQAVSTARDAGCKQLILLKGASTYPATPDKTNISTIPHLKQLSRAEVRLSDHTMGVAVAVASVALGASVIEKQFTLSRSDGGVDNAFSLEPDDLKALVVQTKRALQALGEVTYGPTDTERNSLVFRRPIYVTDNIEEGELLTSKNFRIVRLGVVTPPSMLRYLLCRPSRRSFKKGAPLNLDCLI